MYWPNLPYARVWEHCEIWTSGRVFGGKEVSRESNSTDYKDVMYVNGIMTSIM